MSGFDVERVRAAFPALAERDGLTPIFLDNPGGTQVPRVVAEAMTHSLLEANANLGGAFRSSRAAVQTVSEAHEAMALFLNARETGEVIFGQNMTTLTLHISRSIGRLLDPGDEIILSRMDHDANVAPWQLLARDHGLTVKYLPFDLESYEFDLAALADLLGPRTRLLCIGQASNLTGTINDVRAMTAMAHEAGALVYVDAVQFAPHGAIDVQALDCDFLVCSPYKFFGPHIGVLWGRGEILRALEPYKVRAAGDGLPNRFETGTLNHEGMAGTAATVGYFEWLGREVAGQSYRTRHESAPPRRRDLLAAMDASIDHETQLTRRLLEGLGAFDGVTIHGITNPNALGRRVPTVSFTSDRRRPREIAEALGAREIYVWDGHNYALEPAGALGLLETGGVLRIGLAHYNTAVEVERTLEALADSLA